MPDTYAPIRPQWRNPVPVPQGPLLPPPAGIPAGRPFSQQTPLYSPLARQRAPQFLGRVRSVVDQAQNALNQGPQIAKNFVTQYGPTVLKYTNPREALDLIGENITDFLDQVRSSRVVLEQLRKKRLQAEAQGKSFWARTFPWFRKTDWEEGPFVSFPTAPYVYYNPNKLSKDLHVVRRNVEELLARAGDELKIPGHRIPVTVGGVTPEAEVFDRWRPLSLTDLYRRWAHLKNTFMVPTTTADLGVYNPWTTRTSIPVLSRPTLAHELGHYADYYWQKGPYRWEWHPERRGERVYWDVPVFPPVDRELAATLFARKLLRNEWEQARKKLEPMLGTYIYGGTAAFGEPDFFERTRELAKRHFPDQAVRQWRTQWREKLLRGLAERDPYAVSRAIAMVAGDNYRRSRFWSPVFVWKSPSDSEVVWGPGATQEFKDLVRTLIDEEYRRWLERTKETE